MNYRPALVLALSSALSLGIAACSKDADDAPAGGASSAASDMYGSAATDIGMASDAATTGNAAQTFLLDAIKGNNGEMKLGRLASEKGSSKAVKDFGAMLVRDHGKAGADALTLATAAGLSQTNSTAPEADAEYAKLEALAGADFDKEFARYMVEEHRKTITKFELAAKDTQARDVADFARKTLPTLKKHLEAAQALTK